MIQRGNRLETRIVANVKANTLMPIVADNVAKTAEVYTDEFRVYKALPTMGYSHQTVSHAEKIYVVGNAHTNTLEGFWSLCKNGIRGVYHAVSATYLQHYLNEYSFRYNHRNNVMPMFLSFLKRAVVFERAG
jgi:transposase-like protein